ncbi:hypothetical protein JF110_001662 [Campylobacter jejuni]|nr:hypothetical protein [Campylobacter jejuni]
MATNWPNGQDLSKIPIIEGEESPITPDEDKWGTLPNNARKYVLNSKEFTAVPLTKGLFQVIARNDVPGTDPDEQVIYIADNPSGEGALRVTKNFNIETTGRTALYLRGQSDIDVAIGNLASELGKKANKDDVYTKEQTDQLIAEATGGVINVFTYKGLLPNEEAIKAVVDPKSGDCYQAEDTSEFWVYVVNNDEGEWQKLSGSLIDLSNYYTKGEVDIKLSVKASKTELDALTEVVNMLASRTRPFIYVQVSDPATPEGVPPTDKTKEGETWFNPSTGAIKIRKLGDDGQLFWYDSMENVKIELAGSYVTVDGQQTIKGLKNFQSLPTSEMVPTLYNQFATKQYVDAVVGSGGGGGGGTPGNYVTLDTDQTITGKKTFNSIKAPTSPVEDDDVVNKLYVDESIQTLETKLPVLDDIVTLTTEQTIEGVKTFNNIKSTQSATVDEDLVNLGQIKQDFVDINTKQNIIGEKSFKLLKTTTSPVKDDDVVNLKYFNENKGGGGEIPGNYVTLDTNQTITGKKTFNSIKAPTSPVEDDDVVNLKYFNENKGGGGETPGNYVTLDTDQTITGKKTFNSIKAPTSPVEDDDVVNLKYFNENKVDTDLDLYVKIQSSDVGAFSDSDNADRYGKYMAEVTKPNIIDIKALNTDGVEVEITKKYDLTSGYLNKIYLDVNTIEDLVFFAILARSKPNRNL